MKRKKKIKLIIANNYFSKFNFSFFSYFSLLRDGHQEIIKFLCFHFLYCELIIMPREELTRKWKKNLMFNLLMHSFPVITISLIENVTISSGNHFQSIGNCITKENEWFSINFLSYYAREFSKVKEKEEDLRSRA